MSFIHSLSRADLYSKHLLRGGPGAGSRDAALSVLRKENENSQINNMLPLQKTREKEQNKLKEILKIIQDKMERIKQKQLNKS